MGGGGAEICPSGSLNGIKSIEGGGGFYLQIFLLSCQFMLSSPHFVINYVIVVCFSGSEVFCR